MSWGDVITFCRGAKLLVDLSDTADDIRSRSQANPALIKQARIGNRVVMLLSSVMNFLSRNEDHSTAAVSELVTRVIDVPLQATRLREEEGPVTIQQFSKRVIAPITSVARVGNDMAHPNVDNASEALTVAAEVALSSDATADALISFRNQLLQMKEKEEAFQLPEDITDLCALEFIPKCFHDKKPFNQYTCAITYAPIRHLVCDANGKTFYERSAINLWIEKHHNSPVTRSPMEKEDLIQKPHLQTIIDSALSFYERQLKAKKAKVEGEKSVVAT